MSEEKDFEAIGRYVDAMERVRKLSKRRHDIAKAIIRVLHKCQNTGSAISRFDYSAVHENMSELETVNIELESAVSELNMYAGPARKSQIRIV